MDLPIKMASIAIKFTQRASQTASSVDRAAWSALPWTDFQFMGQLTTTAPS